LLLAEEEGAESPLALFPPEEGEREEMRWRPNLSPLALAYLAELGFDNTGTNRSSARLIWLHALAIGYSPLYLEENADAFRGGWSRIPLPATAETLEESAALGARIGALLDAGTPLPGLDNSTVGHLRQLGAIQRDDGRKPQAGDLAVTAGWSKIQMRRQKSGAVSKIVMPGSGKVVRRPRTAAELDSLSSTQVMNLGDEVLDVYLNDTTSWKNVPEASWNFKIGGFQVLRKWLSYREQAVLGRPLNLDEARQFQSIVRRISELALLGSELDLNYRTTTGSVDQEPLSGFLADQI
jgi:Type ISP C-terminal specificity domain